ncbi:MAG: DNA primase, partial [Thermacetogeniaceae bacterium]
VPRSGESRERYARREKYYQVNLHAAEFYQRMLLNAPEGEEARFYLRKRGVKEDIWKRFMLGFAPRDTGMLLEFLLGKGYEKRFLAECGLFVNHYGQLRDRMAGRVVFPIFDSQGRCLGFGGRALGDEEPKYLNSAETPVFSKGRVLYGINFAAPAIREKGRVLVVEGYMDCISAHQYGFANTVASLGTAFTHEQARLLLRYTKDVILAFDRDAAGSAASLRGAGYLQELGAKVSVLDLPSGKDPDEFLRTYGGEAFESVLENRSVSFLEFKIDQLARQHDPNTVHGKAEIVSGILEDLARVENLVLREGYIKQAAERLGVTEEAIRNELVRYLGRKQGRKDRNEKNRYNMEQGKQIFAGRNASATEAARRGLFRFMCMDRQVWELVREELGFAVFQGKLRRYLELVEEVGWGEPAELISRLDEDEQAEFANLLLEGDDLDIAGEQRIRMIADYLFILKKERLQQEIERCRHSLRECENKNDQEGINNILAELHNLYQELESLKATGSHLYAKVRSRKEGSK